jgi:allantoinase
MAWDVLIRDGSVVTPEGVVAADVAIAGGVIVEVRAGLGGGAKEEIDAAGLTVFPGVIDPHVHFNEPGREHWEGFETGSSALAAGGGTCFFEMPLNADPPTLDGATFDAKVAAARANSYTDFALWGGLTPTNLDRMEELAERGVIGFKAFMSGSGIAEFGRADDLTLFRGMEIAAKLGLPVAVHAESEELTSALSREAIGAGRVGVSDFLASRPIIAEVDAIRRAVLFAQETGCSLHVVHVSSARGGQEAREGKYLRVRNEPGGRALDVTCETCPHYLTLTEEDVVRLGAPAKCAPPVRDRENQRLLWQQLEKGGFDFVASDHSPAPADMKTGDDFFKIWGGIAGVQSTLAIMLSRHPALPLKRVAGLTATNVATRFRLGNVGTLAPGFHASLALVDTAATYTLSRDMLFDRHKLSPYVGRNFRGVIRRTMVRGRTVFQNGKITGQKGCGQLMAPAT